MKVMVKMITLFTIPLLTGCASLTNYAAVSMADRLIDGTINRITKADVKVLESMMEKIMVDTSTYQTIKITGIVEYIPAKTGSESRQFANLSRVFFVFGLFDNDGKLVRDLANTLDLGKDAVIESVEANKRYKFIMKDTLIPKNQWEIIVSHEFKAVIEQ